MAAFKCISNYNAALHFCPVMSFWCCFTGVSNHFHIWARAGCLPAFCELNRAAHHQVTLSGEVILAITIKVPTQATYLSLNKQTRAMTSTKAKGSFR